LWNDILNLIKENRIVILTSHSMEECEALCTRLVIMVNGQFKCLGSPQHLKSKFGNGYKLAIRLNNENESETLYEFMKTNFPSSTIQETHKNLFEFILPFKDTKLSQVFGRIEKSREFLNLKDYSVSQTTLDQIFVNFAKSQHDEKDSNTNTNKSLFVEVANYLRRIYAAYLLKREKKRDWNNPEKPIDPEKFKNDPALNEVEIIIPAAINQPNNTNLIVEITKI
jgi:ABC-type multidrug transport system ATPase subunit